MRWRKPLYGTPGIGIGTYARADGVHLRMARKARVEKKPRSAIEPVEREMEMIFGTAIWARTTNLRSMLHDLFTTAGKR